MITSAFLCVFFDGGVLKTKKLPNFYSSFLPSFLVVDDNNNIKTKHTTWQVVFYSLISFKAVSPNNRYSVNNKQNMIRSSAMRIARASLCSSSSHYFLVVQPRNALIASSQAAAINRRCFSSSSDSTTKKVLYDVVPKEDFGQYSEYSVIFTNRALNLMSDPFQKVMRDLNTLLKHTYNASKVAIIPG